jgi:hypothetical protein
MFLLVYGSIFIFFVVPYSIHLTKLASASSRISIRENVQLNKIKKLQKQIELDFIQQYPDQEYLINMHVPIERCKTTRDTLISYFIYQNTLSIHEYDLSYMACWKEKVYSEASMLKAEKLLEKSISELEKKHGKLTRIWLNRLGKERFMQVARISCEPYFEEMESHQFDPSKVDDFDRFLSEYSYSESKVEELKETIQQEYSETVKDLKKGLSVKEQELIDEQLRQTPGVFDHKKSFRFEIDNLGDFD